MLRNTDPYIVYVFPSSVKVCYRKHFQIVFYNFIPDHQHIVEKVYYILRYFLLHFAFTLYNVKSNKNAKCNKILNHSILPVSHISIIIFLGNIRQIKTES